MFYKKKQKTINNKHNAIFQQHSTLFVVSDQTDSIRGIAKYKVSVTLLRLCCRFFLNCNSKILSQQGTTHCHTYQLHVYTYVFIFPTHFCRQYTTTHNTFWTQCIHGPHFVLICRPMFTFLIRCCYGEITSMGE